MSIKKHHIPFFTNHLLDARRLRKKRKQVSLLSLGSRIFFFIGTSVLVMILGSLLVGGVYLADIAGNLPSIENLALMLEPDGILPATQFYDRSGKILLYSLENPGIERRYLSIDPAEPFHFSPQLIQVFTVLEDNFWSGPGISLSELTNPEPQTITERLVVDYLLGKEPAGVERAIRMRILAVQVQIRYGKAKILEWYLNTAYFGHLAYGADQASQVYLGKSATTLNLAESALLVSLLNTPTLNPLDVSQTARERTFSVLEQLAATGQYSAEDIENAESAELTFLAAPAEADDISDFIQYAIEQLDNSIGSRELERGSLKVITTLDADLQEQIICTLQTQLLRMESTSANEQTAYVDGCNAAAQLPALIMKNSDSPNNIPGANANSLVLDPVTSEILAWSGVISWDGKDDPPNYKAGSLLAPFVATTAFAHGMGPSTMVWDVPKAEDGINLNPDGAWHGPQSLRQTIVKGYFDAIYRTAGLVGYDSVWTLSDTLGLNGLDQTTFEDDLVNLEGKTTLLEIGQAFSTFANLGQQTGIADDSSNTLSPVAVLRVEDMNGNILYGQEATKTCSVLDTGLAFLVHDVLSDIASDTTGRQTDLDIDRPAGAATGIADRGTQVWTVGYTPHHLVVVWMGIPEDAENYRGQTLQAELPGGIWQAIIQYAAQDEPSQDWEKPANVVQVKVCSPSGFLPTAACPEVVDELFLSGSEPFVYDTLYKTFSINSETGNLATVFTPVELVEQRTFFVVPAEYKNWAQTVDIPQPPARYDVIQSQDSIPGVEISSPRSFSYIHGINDIIGSAEGDDFLSYRLDVGQGINPQNWKQIGEVSTEPVKNANLGSWDTTEVNGLYVIRLTIQRSQNPMETVFTQVVVDNTPPEAVITWPHQNREIPFEEGKQIVFLAECTDTLGIDHVTWYIDGSGAGERSVEPYFLSWTMTSGSHTLKAAAFDLAGNVTESKEIVFSVE